MEITTEVSNILKCLKCSEILSCGPVYLFTESQNITCGRCYSNSENNNTEPTPILSKVRYIQYEALASLLLFPCRFQKYGCTHKMYFSPNGPDSHETSCKFKPYKCPMSPNGSCPWLNTLDKLLEHCRNEHPQQIFQNPCHYPPKWNVSSERAFLITYMDLMFLLHVRVCLQNKKLFHSVRLLGDPQLARGLHFVFKAKRNAVEYSKKGSILPAGSLLMEETSGISTQIKNLLEVLENTFERAIFTIIVSAVMVNCKFCQAEMEFSASKTCSKCSLKLRKCHRSAYGCTYEDVNKYKCYKHDYYFCKYRTKCSFSFCHYTFPPGEFFQHFKKDCKTTICSKIGVFWHADHSNEYCILDSYIGPILCNYSMKFSTLYLYIYTSLDSSQLKYYQFVVQIKDTAFPFEQTEIAEVVSNDEYDWKLVFDLKNYLSWNNNGVNINIKINNVSTKI